MQSQFTIPKKNSGEAALDHRQLYAIGLAHVQRLARRIWTDYNVHDPGITILELLCYALTDLGYRASFPVKDLLASETDNAGNMGRQFFTARQILPNRPLTLLDYRKLLIDLKGVKNAWLQPAPRTYYADTVEGKLLRENPGRPGIKEISLAGLYEVLIDYDSNNVAEQKKVESAVRRCLQANRNLCEDFVSFRQVEPQAFNLCCELELTADADVVAVQAEILFQVQNYLAPPVRNYTLDEMLARQKADGSSYTADEIFDGPALACGFIDDEELAQAELRTEIRLSDVMSIIMDIAGVQAIRDIVLQPAGAPASLANRWLIPVLPGRKALLNSDHSRLVFYKRNMPVVPDSTRTQAYLKQLTDAALAKTDQESPYDFPIPQGRFRQPASYYSFQNHFPALYGLSESGLHSAADDNQRALAYQLKGYLLFFDQVMANYFAQLSLVKELFSTDPDLSRTYFYQAVDSFAEYQKIYGVSDPVATIEDAVEEKSVLIKRRHRFLDHLIARFAERFTDFVHIMYATFGASPESLVAIKAEFLNNYPAISSERSLAYNYSLKADKDLWNTDNVSGLEKRLARLLGIRNMTRRNLGDIAYDVYAEVDKTPDDEFRFRIRKKDTGKIILSSSTKYATPELARQEMRRAIHCALLPAGYQRKKTVDGKFYFNVIDNTGEVLARRIEYFQDETWRDQAIDEVMDYLRVNYSDEGMYLIENILLRPAAKSEPFLPICPTAASNVCAEIDPYSFRLHIILPAFGSRFSNMDFRRFAEELIREETPAHLLPKICWISKEEMAVLEKAYRDWIYLQAGAETAQRQEKLAAFIEILFAVRNVYPAEQLRECDASEEQPKFLLGRTALGTEKND
ncbi:MAG: diguanylate cyclase [Deltaproteobacteria bacterium RIFOXYD12_FULL_57_12]|nr:MAG: diguanylate cyclase [Deltaproteobacteria bacterium RIFOXYD12_FULL_57_12]